MKWWAWLVALVSGVLLATVAIFLGPKHMVVCTDARWPNSAFGDMFGHVDGDMFTGCDVPTAATWVVAAVLLLAPVALVAFARRSRS